MVVVAVVAVVVVETDGLLAKMFMVVRCCYCVVAVVFCAVGAFGVRLCLNFQDTKILCCKPSMNRKNAAKRNNSQDTTRFEIVNKTFTVQ